jgi:uncharacterized protein (DUF1501 family)
MLGTRIDLLGLYNEADIPNNPHTIIKIFLRGGCDGLNLVAPIADRLYQDARAEGLKIKDSGENKGLLLKNGLSGLDFCLHPNAAALYELYQSGHLGIIHACGLPNGSRSHFDAQDMIEKGLAMKISQANAPNTSATGWLARYINLLDTSKQLIPAAHIGTNLPLSLWGATNALALENAQAFRLKGDPKLAGLLKKVYSNPQDVSKIAPDIKGFLNQTATETLTNIRIIQQKLRAQNEPETAAYVPDPKAAYPSDNALATSLSAIAQLLKMEVGVSAAAVDMGGWDTHEHQAWVFPELVKKLSEAVGAFYRDIHQYHQQVTVVILSEFGRRLKSNLSQGTDHGHGGVGLVLGGKVNGGRMFGQWLGLDTEQLDHRVDLQVTTDYRSILNELVAPHLPKNANGTNALFPNFQSKNKLGLLK